MPTHNKIYVAPSHTKKIFRNMRRVGKGFSGRETPLFQTMMVQDQAEMGEDNVADEAVNEEMDDNLVRAVTTATSLDVKQDRGNINKTQSKATLNELCSSGTGSGSGPRCQETMRDTIAQTRFENVSKLSNDPLLARGYTLRSGEDSLKLQELMALCITLQSRVLNLETTKTTQANEIAKSSGDEKSLGEDASKQGRRITDIIDDEDITLVNDQIDADAEMFDVDTLTGDEVLAEQVVAAKDVNLSVDEVTLAQALAALKSEKVQEKGDVIKEPSIPVSTITASTEDNAATTTTATISTPRKGIVFQEPRYKVKEEEERLDREKAQQVEEANIAWDDVQAKIDANYQLAQRLQAQEQDELTDEEKARLFVQFFEQRRKHFAAKKAEEKRNRPPTELNKGVHVTELVEESSKKAEIELVEESSKKAEVEIAQESNLKRAGEELEQESSKIA
ncbi:hypothetical protein Tco_0784677 [Tanacetum coccineum]